MRADLGAANTLFLTLGSFGPTFVGAVAERFSFELAFGVLGTSLLLAAAVLTFRATR